MIVAIELNFAEKIDRQVVLASVDEVLEFEASLAPNKFAWFDFSGHDVDHAMGVAERFGIQRHLVEEVTRDRPLPYFVDLEDAVFFTLLDANWSITGVSIVPLAVFFGERFMITVHREESLVVGSMLKSYSRNFRKIALSPGFLLYELADHLCEEYTKMVCQIADDTEVIEDSLFEKSDEAVFMRVADLMRSTVEFYKIVVFGREVIHDLSLSRSPFIPETTQPYLEKKAMLLDRLGADITAERDVLSESVNLYLSIVTHRTNKFLSRLTALGTLFLPLSFMAGVYGMNFEHLPEKDWYYGYYVFWVVAVTFAASMLTYMKKKGWL